MRAEDFFRQISGEIPGTAEIAAEVDPPFILAGNVYRLRNELGLTQAQLAERIGISQPRIAEIERGDANPRLDTLAKLARALGVPVSALLTDSEGASGTAYARPAGGGARRVAESR